MTSATLLISAIASVASCVLCMEVAGISVKDTLVLPAHARKEVVYQKHQDVIKKIESIIRSSRDFVTAERRVKTSVWPDKVLHISLAQRDRGPHPAAAHARSARVATSPDAVFSKPTWTNLRSVIRDGAGYGSVLTESGPREILIVDKTHPTSGTDAVTFLIYFEQPVL
jgi:hypothetical protein